MTRDSAFDLFAAAARRVWENADTALARVALAHDEPAKGVASSLASGGHVGAIGNTIFPMARRYTLRVAARALVLDRSVVAAIMGHEAVHLGIANHGAEFRRLAREHGFVVSEYGSEGGGVRVERKVGHRFHLEREFDDEGEAVAWMREQRRATPGSRWRISQ